MTTRFIEWIKDPQRRITAAFALLLFSIVGWPVTHVLMFITHPPGAASWVFHLLLALSWASITLTAINILATTDIRREQDNGNDA